MYVCNYKTFGWEEISSIVIEIEIFITHERKHLFVLRTLICFLNIHVWKGTDYEHFLFHCRENCES
jgi:hypothetical protein